VRKVLEAHGPHKYSNYCKQCKRAPPSGVKSKTKNTEKTSCASVCALLYCCRHTVNNKGVFTGHGKGLYVQKTSWTETPLLLQYYEIWDNFPRVKRDRNILRARGDKATREDSWIFLLFLFTYKFIRYSLTLAPS